MCDLKKLTILYVEDNKVMQKYMQKVLEKEVKEFHIASNGKEGLKLYKELNSDIIISDISMPIMNGMKMCEHIRREDKTQAIILVTALTNSDILKQIINLNINKLITKPIIDFSKFLKIIKDIAQEIENNEDYLITLSDMSKIQEELVKVEYKAYIDGLTQVYNRNKFDEIFELEIKNLKRSKEFLSVAIIDIDKFKNFNDTYDHIIGDEVLIQMAQTVNTYVRETDIFARWGKVNNKIII